jgi:hypothetical protein
MKKIDKIIVFLFVFIGVYSCQIEEENKAVLDRPAMGNSNIGLKPSQGEEPIHFKDLEKFLPKTIEGYTMEDPEGEALDISGFNVSRANAEYTSSNGDYIHVSILDYNASPSLYNDRTAMWDQGITIDSDDEYAKSFDLNNELSGWETFEKVNNKAKVEVGVGNRLLISVEANNQLDAEKSKDIISLMNLKSLDMAIKGKKNK